MNPCIKSTLLAGLASLCLAAAGPPAEVGINERLGAQVPLDLQLNDEAGKPVTLGSLIDKPTVLTLNYFSCTGICTPLLNGVAEVLGKVQARPGQDFQVITVSFDPRDTPDIAARKRTNYLQEITRPTPPSAWRFLTGPAASTRALCDSVGFNFKLQDGYYIHPGAIMLLSPRGKVTRYMYGIAFLPADLQMAVGEAARGEANPTINRLLRFCFTADPKGRGYVVNFTRIAGSATLVMASAFFAVLGFRKKRHAKP
jgi:protein SCO1/2